MAFVIFIMGFLTGILCTFIWAILHASSEASRAEEKFEANSYKNSKEDND